MDPTCRDVAAARDREAVLRDAYWKYWIDAGESAWWNKAKVSVFEGGDRRPFEVWRPQAGCMMLPSVSRSAISAAVSSTDASK